MGGTRALFASIGVSVSLVAAAALSLFAVSIVIAFGGWSAGLSGSAAPRALLVDDGVATQARARAAAAKPVMLRAPQRAGRQPAGAAARTRSARAQGSHAVVRTPITSRPTPVERDDDADAAVPAPKPHASDPVRRVGDRLSTKVRDTGDALGDATTPLSPPVGEAVQKVADRVADVLQRTTDRAGGRLGR